MNHQQGFFGFLCVCLFFVLFLVNYEPIISKNKIVYQDLNKCLGKKNLILNNISHKLCPKCPCVSVSTRDRQVVRSTLSGCVIDGFLLTLFFHFLSMTPEPFLLLHSAKGNQGIKGMMHLFFKEQLPSTFVVRKTQKFLRDATSGFFLIFGFKKKAFQERFSNYMFLGKLSDDTYCFKVIKMLSFPLANKGKIKHVFDQKAKIQVVHILENFPERHSLQIAKDSMTGLGIW